MKKLWLFALPLTVMANDLHDIVQKVQSSEMIQSLGYKVEAQKMGRDAVISNYLPKLTGSYMYQYIDKDQRGLFDPEHTGSLEASAIIFDGFRRSETIMAQNRRIDSVKEATQHQKEQLTVNAITLYFNLKSMQANIEAKKQKLKQFENELARLERFYKAKSVTEDKVEQMRAAYAMTQYEIALLAQNFQDLAFSLEGLTGVKVQTIGDAKLKDIEVATNLQNHQLKGMQLEVEALDHEAKTKTAGYWPTVIVKDTLTGIKYYPTDTTGLPTALASAFDLPAVTNKLQVVASMTLWDFFAKSNERQAVEKQKLAKKSELDFQKRDADLKKRLARIKLKTVKEKIRSSKVSLNASEKSFEYISKQQQANLVDSTVYLDAATQFYNAKAMLEAANNEYQIALANYYFTNATPLLEMIK